MPAKPGPGEAVGCQATSRAGEAGYFCCFCFCFLCGFLSQPTRKCEVWLKWVGLGVGGEPILIEKKASNSEKAPGICTRVTCKAHKHLSSLNNWINVLLFECIIHNGGNFVSVWRGNIHTPKKKSKDTQSPNHHQEQPASTSGNHPRSQKREGVNKEAVLPSIPAESRAREECPQPPAPVSGTLGVGWGGLGAEWVWDLESPCNAEEKGLKREQARDTAFASPPGLSCVSLRSGFR